MRRFLIAGNWKMNLGPAETTTFFEEMKTLTADVSDGAEVLVCTPFVSLPAAVDAAAAIAGFKVGAQNMHFEDNGAYTGETSAAMLNELGCSYVILGHSERREYFGETDAIVGKKVVRALGADLTPVLCVGEVLAQRKANEQNDVVATQLKGALSGLTPDQIGRTVIAYEPVWAIGTGEVASPQQAQDMHQFIRSVLTELAGKDVADSVRVLYGGSMKPDNAEELLGQPDVDGGLIGGASMKAGSLFKIVEIANKLS
ncbi:MAG: triosephosphate isomerase (TIM) TpiA [Bacteroidetes bacterium HLUCCA01]|nr:MAG: triosephosphate isomerase (TIM) TpiA [Bacteroidetes bacterium HLUCCA01]